MAQVRLRNPEIVERLTRPVGGNRVANAFTDAEALRGMLDDIRKAERKIQFESFLFGGEHGEAIADALIARHREGLDVQVLLDGKAQKLDRERLAKKLREAGVDVRYYNTKAMNAPVAVNHAKLMVVDDALAWVGGVNFDAEVNRDMMSRIEGPATRRIQRTFHEGWTLSGGKVIPVKGSVKPVGDVWVGVAQTGPHERSARQQVVKELQAIGKGDAVDLWMMDLADPKVLDELEAAHRRGAKVRALIDTKVPFTSGKPTDVIMEAIAGGVPDLPGIQRLQDLGVEIRHYTPPKGIEKLHSKVWLFTHKAGTAQETHRVIGGSVNAIKGAYDFNHELGVLMFGGNVGREVKAALEHDLVHASRRIPKLTPWQRFKNEFVKVLTRTLV